MAETNPLPAEINGLPAALGTLASTVTAAGTVIKALSDLLPDEGRTVVVEVVNLTGRALTKGWDHFDHGGFGSVLPAAVIPPFHSDLFTTESEGVAVGVEGWVNYQAESARDFTIHFDDPFVGSNGQSVQSNTDDVLSILGDISAGNHTHARFSVVDRSEPFPSVQSGWASCTQCQGMHFAGIPGACPAGGTHNQTGSFAYQMIYNSRHSGNLQSGWASCPKCQGLHFAGFPDKGACPAGGQHEQSGSFTYDLSHDVPSSPGDQSDWRACVTCNGLFFGPLLGRCPTGGTHDATRSFNYLMKYSA